MPFDPRALAQILGAVGGLRGGSNAFTRRWKELEAADAQKQQQAQQLQMQQQRMGLEQGQADRAQQQLMLQADAAERQRQQQQFGMVTSARGMLEDPEVTDPAVFDQRMAFLQQMAPGIDPGFLQSLRPPPTVFQQRAAKKKIAEIEKTYSPAQLQMLEADDQSGAAPVFEIGGERLTLAQLRERAGTQSMVGGKAMSMRPPATGGDVTAGSFEEYVNAPPERQTQIEGARQRYAEAGREPNQPAQGSPQWVITKTGAVRFRVPQEGDMPRDAVAERQNTSAVQKQALAVMRSYGDDMLKVIGELLDTNGNLKPAAAGVIGGVSGVRPEWAYVGEGSQEALAAIDRLQSMLNIDTLRDMKTQSRTGATGFGQLTERELSVIEASASTLRRRRQSEAVYAAELKRLRGEIQRGRQGTAGQRANPVLPPSGGDEWVDVGGGVRIREKR